MKTPPTFPRREEEGKGRERKKKIECDGGGGERSDRFPFRFRRHLVQLGLFVQIAMLATPITATGKEQPVPTQHLWRCLSRMSIFLLLRVFIFLFCDGLMLCPHFLSTPWGGREGFFCGERSGPLSRISEITRHHSGWNADGRIWILFSSLCLREILPACRIQGSMIRIPDKRSLPRPRLGRLGGTKSLGRPRLDWPRCEWR